ncbi:MAG: DUF1501 domain-containing protein [Bacteroidota bacterium]
MKRRDFLKYGAAGAITPMILNGLPLNAFATENMITNLCDDVSDRILVVVFLNGANDGLNNLVPLDQYSDYAGYRPDIRLQQNTLINLDTNLGIADQIGLHPSLQSFKNLYDNQKLTVVQGVSYPTPDKSHFRSRELMGSGLDGSTSVSVAASDGWIGRFMDHRYPNYVGYPFTGNLDPLGIRIGGAPARSFNTLHQHQIDINLSRQDPLGYFSLISSISGEPIPNIPSSDYGTKLQLISQVENNVNFYAERISDVFSSGSNSVSYPSENLANQLKTVARLINGGCQTQVYMCNLGGWDTHANQVDDSDTTQGHHANQLSRFSNAVSTFQSDLEAMGMDNRVLTVVFSEFGRKVIQNGNYGTDHGTLGPMYLVGSHVEPGVIGTNIDLTNQDNQGAPHPSQTQHDYRQVFGTLLQDWLGTADNGMQDVGFDGFTKLPLVKTAQVAPASCYLQPFIIQPPGVQLQVWLEGYYNSTLDQMVREDTGDIPLHHPFQVQPFAYYGDESFITKPSGFIDWLLVELRDKNDINNVVGRKAVWLHESGRVRSVNNSDDLRFENLLEDDYTIVIYSRNHLPAVSKDPITMPGTGFADLDLAETTLIAGNMKLVNGKQMMVAGDMNQDGVIDLNDLQDWMNNRALIGGYRTADLDGNAVVNTHDHNLWKQNEGSQGYFN